MSYDSKLDSVGDFVMMKMVLPVCLILIVGAIVGGVGAGIWYGGKWIFGDRDPWSCEYSVANGTSTTMVLSGKVMVPVTTTNYDCVLWSREDGAGIRLSNGQQEVVVTPTLEVVR